MSAAAEPEGSDGLPTLKSRRARLPSRVNTTRPDTAIEVFIPAVRLRHKSSDQPARGQLEPMMATDRVGRVGGEGGGS
eukprot:1667450-Pyramimonas_sp.AAC.1